MGKVSGVSLWLQDPNVGWVTQGVGELLRHRAEHDGSRPALHWPHPGGGVATVDYATLYTEARRLARGLLEHVSPGDAVAVYAPNSVEWVLLEFACGLAGTVLVPMNPAMADSEVAHILSMSRSRLVLADEEYRGSAIGDRIRAVAAQRWPQLPVLNLKQWARVADGSVDLPDLPADSRFLIQYTSGTTGKPKGAVLTQEAALNAGGLWCTDWGHTADDVLVSAVPLHHVGASVAIVLGSLVTGASFGLMHQYDPAQLLNMLKSTRATVTAAVPTMLLDLLGLPGANQVELPHLHTVMGGGAFVPPEAIRAVEERFGVRFVVTYGQSESPAILQTRRDDPIEVKAGSLGRPLPGRDVRIVGSDGVTLPDGEVGEICTRGKIRMLEYIGQPSETASVIDEDGWLHTGDLGSMDVNGYVTSRGRARDVVIRGGENVYPDEVEATIGQHTGVSAVAVVGKPDARWGEVPVGFVVPEPGYQPRPEDLVAFGRERLASFKVPRQWFFLSSLPMTASGKVRKVQLQSLLEDSDIENQQPPWTRKMRAE